jgi:hypothetical protein
MAATPLVGRFVVGVDVENYSGRTPRHQQKIQQDLDDVLREASEAAGLHRDQWRTLGAGDGELAVLPPDVDMVPVVNGLVRELGARLRRRNADHAPELRIRLRMAMHVDAVIPSIQGYAGQALIVLTRLLDSEAVHGALRQAPAAPLALIVSEPVHRMVVLSGFGELGPEDFVQVRVTIPAKGFDEAAHLHVPGHVPDRLARTAATGSSASSSGDTPDEPTATAPAPAPTSPGNVASGASIHADRDQNVGGDLFVGTKTVTDLGERP